MTIQDFLTFFVNFAAIQDIIIKTILVLLIILFALFALVLARHISLLTNLVNQVSFTPIFKLLAYGTVFVSIALLVLVILV